MNARGTRRPSGRSTGGRVRGGDKGGGKGGDGSGPGRRGCLEWLWLMFGLVLLSCGLILAFGVRS